MNKLTIRDKCILLTMVLCLLTYAGYHFLWFPVNTEIQLKTQQEMELKSKVGDGEPLENQIAGLQSQDKELTEALDQHKLLEGGKSLNKEDFLTFLTDKCAKSNTELIKFNDLGITEDGSTWKAQFDFELRGNLPALNSVCQAIDQINIRYSVGGFSLRQSSNHDYLERFFDDSTRLEWYKDDTPKPEETQKPESNNAGTSENPIELPSLVPSVPETEPPLAQPPVQTPEPTPQPSTEPKDKTITDRLDSLLEQTSTGNVTYKIMLLTNTESAAEEFMPAPSEDIMLLNITVEFVMCANPKDFSNSFLTSSETGV